jgi:hypothetical protein
MRLAAVEGPRPCAFSFRQAVAWAKQRRLAKVNEWKPMFVVDRAKRQRCPRGKAAIALGAVLTDAAENRP